MAAEDKLSHGGNIRKAIEKYRLHGKKILDFSANINPLGLPPRIKKIITDNIQSISHYPDPECVDFRNALSRSLKIDSKNLLVGNGASELIFLLVRALRPERVVIPTPSFSEYESAAGLTNGECIFFKTEETENFEIKMESLIERLPGADLIFLCNPNNPTGNIVSQKKLLLLSENCKKHNATLVIDESFIEFVENVKNTTMVKIAVESSNILVLRSLTKFFAMPGLRAGYLVGNEKTIKKIFQFQPPWSVNHFAQLVGKEAIEDAIYIRKSKKYIMREREKFFRELSLIDGLKPYHPTANFIFCKLTNEKSDSKKLAELLGKKGLLIRDCSNFRGLGNKFFRVAVRKREENIKLISALKKCFYTRY